MTGGGRPARTVFVMPDLIGIVMPGLIGIVMPDLIGHLLLSRARRPIKSGVTVRQRARRPIKSGVTVRFGRDGEIRA